MNALSDCIVNISDNVNHLHRHNSCHYSVGDMNEDGEEMQVLQDSSVFKLGESFDSYDALIKRLNSHSQGSLVHYWRRDSRTVQGAHMKTARPIEAKLKYYSVKFACVYGGQKFSPRGKGQRNTMSMRTDCPSHIMVRANKAGQKLEVISVCNHHNHPITKELYQRLRQDRRLPQPLKIEVLDLLKIGVDRRRIRDYVYCVTGKQLTNKDLLNLAALDKRVKVVVSSQRHAALKELLNKYECTRLEKITKDSKYTRDRAKVNLVNATDKASLPRKRKYTKMNNKIRIKKEEDSQNDKDEQQNSKIDMALTNRLPIVSSCLHISPEYMDTNIEGLPNVDGEIEINFEENESDNIVDRSIMNYFYNENSNCEKVVTVLETTKHNVIIENMKYEGDHQLAVSHDQLPSTLGSSKKTSPVRKTMATQKSGQVKVRFVNFNSVLSNGHTIEDSKNYQNTDIILDHCPNDVMSTQIAVTGTNELFIGKLPQNETDSEQETVYLNQEISENCVRCSQIKDGLDVEVQNLKSEKEQLTRETVLLRIHRDNLINDIKNIQNLDLKLEVVGSAEDKWQVCDTSSIDIEDPDDGVVKYVYVE